MCQWCKILARKNMCWKSYRKRETLLRFYWTQNKRSRLMQVLEKSSYANDIYKSVGRVWQTGLRTSPLTTIVCLRGQCSTTHPNLKAEFKSGMELNHASPETLSSISNTYWNFEQSLNHVWKLWGEIQSRSETLSRVLITHRNWNKHVSIAPRNLGVVDLH